MSCELCGRDGGEIDRVAGHAAKSAAQTKPEVLRHGWMESDGTRKSTPKCIGGQNGKREDEVDYELFLTNKSWAVALLLLIFRCV